MKVALVILLARYLSKNLGQVDGYGLKNLAIPILIAFIPFAFTVEQPDLGTALLLLAISGTMFLFVKVKTKILISCFILAVIAAPLAWEFGLKDYQKERVLNFLSPGRDPRGSGYNSIQSKIAVGSGKVLGKGFRKGTQSQLEFLPERHTDFIFSVLSEEHGFIGSITTIALFTVLFIMGIRISSQARERFGSLLVVGLLSILFWHYTVNIGMVIGLLPIVGLPLPLVSYGGSSLLTTMASLGLISSVAYRKYLF
jgi:rod shape determining protein RodA